MSPLGVVRADGAELISPDRIELLCDLQRWSDALPLVHRLLAVDPEDDVAWCHLSQCELGLGRHEAALDAAEHAATLAPETEWPHRLISFAASHLGRHDLAVNAAQEAVRLEPEAWQTHVRLASALLRRSSRSGRWNRGGRRDRLRAARHAGQAVELAPNEPQVQLIQGSVATALGRRAEAEAAYRAALELDPNSAGAHHLLASLRMHRTLGPTALAAATAGFATALATDPKAHASRRSLDLAVHTFLGRAAYGLFAVAYLSQLFVVGDSVPTRAVPLLMLCLPAVFVVGFVGQLEPRVRKFLLRTLGQPVVLAAVGLEAACVLLMLATALAPQGIRPPLAALAAILALLARLALFLTSRRI